MVEVQNTGTVSLQLWAVHAPQPRLLQPSAVCAPARCSSEECMHPNPACCSPAQCVHLPAAALSSTCTPTPLAAAQRSVRTCPLQL